MNSIKNGKYTGDSCFGCSVKIKDCELIDKIYRRRWIPVSERLPEVTGDYLIYQENNNVFGISNIRCSRLTLGTNWKASEAGINFYGESTGIYLGNSLPPKYIRKK